MSRQRILVVEDAEVVREAVTSFLASDGFDVTGVGDSRSALEACGRTRFEAAVVDYALPDGNALELIASLKEQGLAVPVVVLTGHGSIDLAVRAIKEGAEHFLTKPVELPVLAAVVRRVADGARVRRREAASRTQHGRRVLDPFLGESLAIRKLADEARALAGSDSPVLLQGETGSGKGVLARWLHDNGPRAEETFVDLNCAGLQPQFLETELFGHERGAFTGAVQAKVGLFDLAHRGTLFLDEIGDVDAAVQPKLLKVLEEKRFRRLGDVRDRVVDVRLIAATHQDLETQVREKKFRSDLFFRINTLPLRLPPLRERAEDVPLIARTLLEAIGADLGKPSLRLSAPAEAALRGYSWPGNVRELRNVLERAVLLSRGEELGPDDLRFNPGLGPVAAAPSLQEIVSLPENEKRYLEQVLRACGGKVEEAARALGLPRSSLYQKIKRLGVMLSRG